MSENTSHSSAMSASEASRIMADPNSSAEERSVAASVLRQAEGGQAETSPGVASEASDLMRNGTTAEDRSVAASDLSQADKQRDQNA